MRYYLKIGDYEFPNVSEMAITGVFRKESIQQNLAGGYLIDRAGTEKITINAKLNMLSWGEMYTLIMARNQISNTVEYERGDIRKTAQMIIREFEEPTPVKYDDKSNAYGARSIYRSVNITLEEI